MLRYFAISFLTDPERQEQLAQRGVHSN